MASCRLHASRGIFRYRAVVGGLSYRVKVGAWAFYIPRLNAKILHSVRGHCHCIHATAPGRDNVCNDNALASSNRYSITDWRAAYSKSTARRAAENYVAARRLYECNLGPKVSGCIAVRNFEPFYGRGPSRSFGIIVEDLRTYPTKTAATLEQIEAAGLVADRSRSCVRQQIRGYVSDLNSVVGVVPVDAEDEVRRIQQQLEHACEAQGTSE